MKKLLSIILIAAICSALFIGCGRNNSGNDTTATSSVYLLNFKPEIESAWNDIAKAYKEEKGVDLKVVTAASGTYETTLKSEMAKEDAPAIFVVNGPVGLESWKDYCADLKNTELYNMLSDKSMALTSDDKVLAIPYTVEGYGIIYNNAIMNKYFASSKKTTPYTSMDEIKNFEALKAIVEDMTKNCLDELGIQGVFSSTSLASGEQWRWQSHLANVPFYYEFLKDKSYDSTILKGLNSPTVDFSYADNFKNIFDLYINNSVTKPSMLSNVTVETSMSEFALGQSAMVQNGNWAASQILEVKGNTVNAADIKFLPIYTGIAGEESQGLCVGTENNFCINSKLSEEKQKAALDFLVWLFSSDTGKQIALKQMDFIAPFNTFTSDELPEDPLSQEVMKWMNKDGITSIQWTFNAFPSDAFKNYFGDVLLEYAQGQKTWDQVKKTVVDAWASEYKATK